MAKKRYRLEFSGDSPSEMGAEVIAVLTSMATHAEGIARKVGMDPDQWVLSLTLPDGREMSATLIAVEP